MTMPSKAKKMNSSETNKKPGRLAGVGHLFDEEVLNTHDYIVDQAVVDAEHIAMDWTEGSEKYHFRGESTDGGSTYRGYVGFPRPDANCPMTIQRFTATNGAELLLATWYRRDEGQSGLDIILLSQRTQ